ATVNIPAIALSVGPMLNGWWNGKRAGSGTVIWKAREMLARGEIEPAAADRLVQEIDQRPARYAGLVLLFGFVLVSGGACTLIGGGWREALLATALGGVTGLSVLLLWRRTELSRLLMPLSAGLVTFFGTLWCGFDPDTALMPAVIAGMIALVPGMDLTSATRELATGHQVSGAARLASAIAVFALLTVGLALGGWLAQELVGQVPVRQPSDRPPWLLPLSVGMAGIGFVVLFQARWRDWIWVMAACALAWAVSGLGATFGSPVLGAFLGALLVGASGNLFARITGRPGSIFQLPGLILLVPGSIGMRSLSALVSRDVISGIETGFLALLIAVALTAGLILASALVPPKISL
ncbi:MAG: threonine/serine exporter family protein, partial [Wenzhouxiangellaceae bacterium]